MNAPNAKPSPSTLTEDQHARRIKGIGGSDAPKLMAGKWAELYQQKQPGGHVDLSHVFEVRLGILSEDLNAEFFSRRTGIDVEIPPANVTFYHPDHAFILCHPDRFTLPGEGHAGAVLQLKHTAGWTKPEELVERYYWQLQHEMLCTGYAMAVLSPVYGNRHGEPIYVAANADDQAKLITACVEFWWHVANDSAPEDMAEVQADAPIIVKLKVTAMAGEPSANEWGDAAARFLEHTPARTLADKAESDLKKLAPDDARVAWGNGVAIMRSKDDKLSVRKIDAKIAKAQGLPESSILPEPEAAPKVAKPKRVKVAA